MLFADFTGTDRICIGDTKKEKLKAVKPPPASIKEKGDILAMAQSAL